MEFLSHRLEPNEDFLRVTVPSDEADVSVRIFFSLCISLEEPVNARGRDAWYWLNDARKEVIEIITALVPFCGDTVPPDMAQRWEVAEPDLSVPTGFRSRDKSSVS